MAATFQGLRTLQYSPDNKHAFGSSGVDIVNNTEEDMIVFSTQSNYLVGAVQAALLTGGDDYRYRVYFNDIEISSLYASANSLMVEQRMHILVPPFTDVRITAQNISDASGQYNVMTALFDVKGTIEQFDLEIKQ
jgi:hypothetical protein